MKVNDNNQALMHIMFIL